MTTRFPKRPISTLENLESDDEASEDGFDTEVDNSSETPILSPPPSPPKKKKIRYHAKKIGVTNTCPVNAQDNPIRNSQELVDVITARFGQSKYTVGEELHESGKRHYHAYFHFDNVLDQTKCTFMNMDFKDDRPFKKVQANICPSYDENGKVLVGVYGKVGPRPPKPVGVA